MDKAPWRIRSSLVVVLAIPFGIAFLGMLILPMLASTGKLYGNNLMRAMCYQQVRNLKRAETNSLNFDFFKLPDDTIKYTILSGVNSDFWIRTNFSWAGGESNRQVIIVCGKQFDNVPKPGFWNYLWRNPAHAVGFSDGKTGLISPEQFSNLISADFVSMSILATNPETGLFK